jgi:hypothetical protein
MFGLAAGHYLGLGLTIGVMVSRVEGGRAAGCRER